MFEIVGKQMEDENDEEYDKKKGYEALMQHVTTIHILSHIKPI